MNAVFGGWMCGYVMSVLSTVALTYLCIQPNVLKGIQKYLDVPGMLLAVPFSIGTGMVWTLVGMMLGAFYKVGDFPEREGAVFAPSWEFLLIIGSVAWLPVPILFLFSRGYWWIWSGMSLAFILLFGWVMPFLAER